MYKPTPMGKQSLFIFSLTREPPHYKTSEAEIKLDFMYGIEKTIGWDFITLLHGSADQSAEIQRHRKGKDCVAAVLEFILFIYNLFYDAL
jgi:hypothetical protein